VTRRNDRAHQPSEPDLGEPPAEADALPRSLAGAELEDARYSNEGRPGRDAAGLNAFGCRFEGIDVSEASLRRVRLRDSLIHGGSLANADATEASFVRTELRGVRATGVTLTRAKLVDVTFAECRLDFSSVRSASLERVRFEGCRMEEADLSGVSALDVVFEGCDLTRASLAEVRFERCEMVGCSLDGIGNPERLRDVGMPWQDVLRSAATLAAGIGVRILEDEAV
jgi:uncharacterized protein YjbI with pentapeptide repeats